jgi:hypothetical protein
MNKQKDSKFTNQNKGPKTPAKKKAAKKVFYDKNGRHHSKNDGHNHGA